MKRTKKKFYVSLKKDLKISLIHSLHATIHTYTHTHMHGYIYIYIRNCSGRKEKIDRKVDFNHRF